MLSEEIISIKWDQTIVFNPDEELSKIVVED